MFSCRFVSTSWKQIFFISLIKSCRHDLCPSRKMQGSLKKCSVYEYASPLAEPRILVLFLYLTHCILWLTNSQQEWMSSLKSAFSIWPEIALRNHDQAYRYRRPSIIGTDRPTPLRTIGGSHNLEVLDNSTPYFQSISARRIEILYQVFPHQNHPILWICSAKTRVYTERFEALLFERTAVPRLINVTARDWIFLRCYCCLHRGCLLSWSR